MLHLIRFSIERGKKSGVAWGVRGSDIYDAEKFVKKNVLNKKTYDEICSKKQDGECEKMAIVLIVGQLTKRADSL